MKSNKIKWLFILLFLNMPPVLANKKLVETKPNAVVVNFSMAERMLDWFVFVKQEQSANKRKIEFIKLLESNGGCKAIIDHWSRFDNNWNLDAFYLFVAENLGLVDTQKELVDSNGNSTPFSTRRKLWKEAFENPGRIRRFIEQLKMMNWNDRLEANVKINLPPEVQLNADFYFVIFGASSGFSVNNDIALDVLQLPVNSENELELDDIFRTASHELHHFGFSLSANKTLANINDLERINLVGLMTAEGIATHLYQQPFERYLNRPITKMKDGGVIRDWQNKISRLPKMFLAAEQDIYLGLSGQFEGKPLYQKWLDGHQGDAYILGATMIRLIEQELDKDKMIELNRDYRKLLSFYNMAAIKANKEIDNVNLVNPVNLQRNTHYIFSHQLANLVADFEGKNKRLP